jgi:hypothetical protein
MPAYGDEGSWFKTLHGQAFLAHEKMTWVWIFESSVIC